MNCQECRNLLLEADAASSNDDHWANEHLQSCDQCREVAATIVRRQREMQGAYLALVPDHTVSDVVATARRAIVSHPGIVVQPSFASPRIWGRLSLAAAASVAVVVGYRALRPLEAPPLSAPVAVDSEPTLAVEVPAGHNVMVMTTNNPKISVVWIY